MSEIPPSIARQLTAAEVAITNICTCAELQAALAPYAFTPERMQQGQALLATAAAQCQRMITVHDKLHADTAALASIARQTLALYKRHVLLARLAFADKPRLLSALKLNGPRKRSLRGWTEQARYLYITGYDPDPFQTRLDLYSLTPDIIAEGKRQIDMIRTQELERTVQRRFARIATSARNTALTKLNEWMHELKFIARIALKDRPQLLEMVDVKVSSTVQSS